MRNAARTSILSIIVLSLIALPLVLAPAPAEAVTGLSVAGPDSQSGSSRIPAEARNRKNPVPDVPGAVKAGGDLFASQCAMCHGQDGNGRGDVAISLKMKVPDLRDPALQKKRTDGDLFYLISTGHEEMPAEKRLSERNRWEMVRFIRSLGRKQAKEKS